MWVEPAVKQVRIAEYDLLVGCYNPEPAECDVVAGLLPR
jgi:hypothetical protein